MTKTTRKKAAPKAPQKKAHVLLTGATGFVGKVVLEELTRRADELGIEAVYPLVRPRKGSTAQHRFDKSIANSDCFSKRTDDSWTKMCVPVACELTSDDCGIAPADLEMLTGRITHVIHCAASVEFDLPIAEAASANIKAALNVLGLAQRCTKLVNMVSVSTAYVSVHQSDSTPIHEELQPLPRKASDIYAQILAGDVDEKELLHETGHANTYTVTKCIAEHLLLERRGKVPVTIVRPSIVSACLETPFPGWIDSLAGFAGFVALCGSGHLRVVNARRDSRADFVPCDVVSHRVVNAALTANPPKAAIRYAVAGQKNVMTTGEHCDTIVAWFRRHPVDRRPGLEYVGNEPLRLRMEKFLRHELPTTLARKWYGWNDQKAAERAAAAVGEHLHFLNSAFANFTTNTFDFRTKLAKGERELRFDPKEYCELVCQGVYTHLLKRDESSVPIAGKSHRESTHDVLWSAKQPAGNATIRSLAVLMRGVFRNSTSEVTVDRASFRAAMDGVPRGTRFVMLPTHRSYADFIVMSYLAFARPELGLDLPHIAAAEEFSRIPLLGKLFKMGGAFYIKRGQGKADPELVATINRLVAEGKTLEFFVEGQRSRSRQFLQPRHGLLKCLQGTGEKFALLPISISYDRIPEEASLLRELRGAPKGVMKLSPLFAGAKQLKNGELSYGRVHIKCGEAVMLSPSSDAKLTGRLVMGELQANMPVSTFHLKAFLAKNTLPGITLDWLVKELESRGAEVIESPLRADDSVDSASEMCMRYHWAHHFYADALAMWPDHLAIAHHVSLNDFLGARPSSKAALAEPRLRALLRALFEPVARDYALVAAKLGTPEWAPRHASPRSVLYENPHVHLPNVQAAFADLVSREILAVEEDGAHTWGPKAHLLPSWGAACALPAEEKKEKEPVRSRPVIVASEESVDSVEQREVGT